MKDAEAVRDKLVSFGFKVECAKNPRHDRMVEKLSDFIENLNENVSDIVIYYAGHGCNIGEPFLLGSPLANREILTSTERH